MMMVYYNTVLHAKFFVQLVTPSALAIEKAMDSVVLVTDFSLAFSLVILLHRSRTGGFTSSDSVIKLIIAFTIGTSLITALLLLVALVSVNTNPDSFLWLASDLLASKRESACLCPADLSDSP